MSQRDIANTGMVLDMPPLLQPPDSRDPARCNCARAWKCQVANTTLLGNRHLRRGHPLPLVASGSCRRLDTDAHSFITSLCQPALLMAIRPDVCPCCEAVPYPCSLFEGTDAVIRLIRISHGSSKDDGGTWICWHSASEQFQRRQRQRCKSSSSK